MAGRRRHKVLPIYTAGEKCKKCYSCVRACPTKAIEVHEGQANIIEEKCISCGHCVPRCSQGAKRVRSSVGDVRALIDNAANRSVRAIVAPSFPAAFLDAEPERIVGAIAAAGFSSVHEVAFGADLVSYAYHLLYASKSGQPRFHISSPCPAVVSFVEKVHPELTPFLAPIMSPMEAMATVIKSKIDPEAAVVFIGPCVAKKAEASRSDLVDAVLTYTELIEVLESAGIDYRDNPPREFDPPLANLGKIYPVTGGLLKAAAIDAALLQSPVVGVEGSARVSDILEVLSDRVRKNEPVLSSLFDLLFCEGCIAGPIMPNDLTFYERKKYIVDYMKRRPLVTDMRSWVDGHREYLDLDISKRFTPAASKTVEVPESEIRRILALTGKVKPEDELNCRACGYASCRDKAIAVYRGIAEVEMCLPYLISKLEVTIDNLKENQQRLIQAEKLASMGQMAADTPPQITNPLAVVLIYPPPLKQAGPDNQTPAPAPPSATAAASASTSASDLDRIISEAERARTIIRGVLNFARVEHVQRQPVDINALLVESVEAFKRTAGHVSFVLDLDENLGTHAVDAAQLRQVFDNIITNAAEAMSDTDGTVQIHTEEGAGSFRVLIDDTGPGIPENVLQKLFTPFFTTKPIGKGTGLGLAVCYGIVNMHGGSIRAGNRPEGGARFDIRIPDAEVPDAAESPVNTADQTVMSS